MNAVATLSQGRYLLLVDILGFSALVQTKGREEVLETIKAALKAFGRWEDLNQQFKTIYFSDTFCSIRYRRAMDRGLSWMSMRSPVSF